MKKKLAGLLVLLQNALVANVSMSESLIEKSSHFQTIPKAELHLHLGGSYPKEYLFSLATEEQRKELEEKLDVIAKGVNYHEAFRVFQIISQVVNSEEKLQKGVEELCLELQRDGVSYVEIRTGLKDLGNGPEEYLKAVLSGIKKSVSENFEAVLVLSLQRNSSIASAEMTVDLALKYRNQGIVGMDISGDSTIGQIEQIIPQLLRAKQSEISFVVHVGESPYEVDQMFLLQTLEPKRVGHGVYLSAEAMDWILANKVPVEVCLTSSVLVKMIDEYSQHPGMEFFRLGHPVAFCTDDPLLFSTTLSKELAIAEEFGNLSREDVEKIAKNAFDQTLKGN